MSLIPIEFIRDNGISVNRTNGIKKGNKDSL